MTGSPKPLAFGFARNVPWPPPTGPLVYVECDFGVAIGLDPSTNQGDPAMTGFLADRPQQPGAADAPEAQPADTGGALGEFVRSSMERLGGELPEIPALKPARYIGVGRVGPHEWREFLRFALRIEPEQQAAFALADRLFAFGDLDLLELARDLLGYEGDEGGDAEQILDTAAQIRRRELEAADRLRAVAMGAFGFDPARRR